MSKKETLSILIETNAINNKSSVMAELIAWCDEQGREFREIAPYLSDSLKEKIREDAIEQGYMTDTTTTLPL